MLRRLLPRRRRRLRRRSPRLGTRTVARSECCRVCGARSVSGGRADGTHPAAAAAAGLKGRRERRGGGAAPGSRDREGAWAGPGAGPGGTRREGGRGRGWKGGVLGEASPGRGGVGWAGLGCPVRRERRAGNRPGRGAGQRRREGLGLGARPGRGAAPAWGAAGGAGRGREALPAALRRRPAGGCGRPGAARRWEPGGNYREARPEEGAGKWGRPGGRGLPVSWAREPGRG